MKIKPALKKAIAANTTISSEKANMLKQSPKSICHWLFIETGNNHLQAIKTLVQLLMVDDWTLDNVTDEESE